MPSEWPAPIKILLVDDKPENLFALKAVLEAPGREFVAVRSGEEALVRTLNEEFALVLLDVVMPGMDGFEVAKHLRQRARTRSLPIIFLTAVATDVNRIYAAYAAGAVDYIVKPVDSRIVRSKVAVFEELFRYRKQLLREAEQAAAAERRELELRLKEMRLASDARYQKLVEGIDHTIAWSADADNLRLTFLSRQAEAVLGCGPGEIADPAYLLRHIHPDDRETALAVFRRATVSGEDQVCDHRMVTSDGELRWFHTGVSPERGQGSEDTDLLHGISVDVTTLKRAEEEALKAARMREDLVAIVSHDLRTPLTALLTSAGALELALQQSPSSPASDRSRAEHWVRAIVHTAERMERLTNDLLDVAVIEAGELRLEREPGRLARVVRDVAEMLRPLAEQKGLTLDLRLDDELWASFDHDRVSQVVTNLATNAIKFTPEGGRVTLGVERAGGKVRYIASHTGPGIPESDLPRVFDRFWREGKGQGKAGAGLGLSIAKGIIDAHGGRIWAESEPGAGATMCFELSAVPGPATEHERADSPGI